jgi:hypothetical protein
MQSAKKAVQAGAPQGETPSGAGRKTLRLKSSGDRETAGMEEREGMEKGEMTFS